MAYIFDNKETVVEYLRQLEITVGEEYNHYIVPHHSYVRRFDIFYNSENIGYVENEELTPNAKSEWVIHIPSEKRAYLEAKQKGLYGAIYDLPNESYGDIDKKYYIEPRAFTRIIAKKSDNTPIQVDANGPGAYVGLKFNNSFVNLDKTEVALGSTQLNITIDPKKLANELKYSFAEISGSLPTGVVVEPEGISIQKCLEYPSIIVATEPGERPKWVKAEELTVGKAASAANADLFGFKKPEDYVTYQNINTDITSYFDNSYNYGFRTGYDMDTGNPYVYTRAYKVHLVGDISGDAEVSNFEDIDIECTIAEKSKWKEQLLRSLTNPTSGIVYDTDTEKLKIDFSRVPRDTSEFDDLIQSLDMQAPLRANKSVYVDCNAGEDTLIDKYSKKIDRGSKDLPFKTINACIKYITSNYALGEYNINVYIAPGTYTEKVMLPSFDSTSGYIVLRAKDYNNPPIITNDTYNGYTVNILGGTWRLVRLDIRMNAGIPRKSGSNLVGSELTEADLNMTTNSDAQAIHMSGGTCRIYGCNIQTEFNEADPVPSRTIWVECIRMEGNSTLYFVTLLGNDIFYPNTLTCIKNNVSNAKIMYISDKSTVALLTYNTHITDAQKETIFGNNVETIFFNGDVHTALYIDGGSTFRCGSGGNHQQLVGGNLVGRKYYVAGASSILIRNLPNHEGEEIDGLESGIPGTIKGIIKSEEFAWKRIL